MLVKQEKFYDMQNFALNLFTNVNKKIFSTVVDGIDICEYVWAEWELKLCEYHVNTEFDQKEAFEKDVKWVMENFYHQFTFTIENTYDDWYSIYFKKKA